MLNQALVDEVFEENWRRIVKPNGQWDYERIKWALASYTLSVEFGAKESDRMLYSSETSAEPASPRPL